MRYRIATILVLMGLGCGLAGCGQRPGERALTGGAIGAGAGTVGAVLLGANPVAGALIGGGAGALTGAVTSPRGVR
jgi:osmotically inducible lipoprotein OsmB